MKILFQGDSITDTGRTYDRGSMDALGQGYATMVAGELGYENPGKYTFENRGISGNRIVDLYSRIKADMWNLKPDVVSILIGVNDVLHEFMFDNGVDCDRFERVYDMLIEDTYKALPGVKLILMEPFVAKGALTEENWDFADKEVKLRAEAVKRLAQKHNAVFVPLQCHFDELMSSHDASYWIADGVHPTVFGHKLIKDKWLEAFEKITK